MRKSKIILLSLISAVVVSNAVMIRLNESSVFQREKDLAVEDNTQSSGRSLADEKNDISVNAGVNEDFISSPVEKMNNLKNEKVNDEKEESDEKDASADSEVQDGVFEGRFESYDNPALLNTWGSDDGDNYRWSSGKCTIKRVKFEKLANSKASIIKYLTNHEKVSLPTKIKVSGKYYHVTEIADDAFRDCVKLVEVDLPGDLVDIDEHAFMNCERLTTVKIPSSVETIDDGAFQYCEKLININLPSHLEYIGEDAFWGCESLENVVFPESLTRIKSCAFGDCMKLKSVTIPKNVRIIGQDAFKYCNSMASITVDPNNQNYASYDGALLTKNFSEFMVCPAGRTVTSYTIPRGVTKIDQCAFYECNNIQNIVIPDTVTTIEMHAFSKCSNLTTINVPPTVTSVGSTPFSSCNANLKIKVKNQATKNLLVNAGVDAKYIVMEEDWANNTEKVISNIKYKKINDTTVAVSGYASGLSGAVSIPAQVTLSGKTYNVTSIGASAFSNCTAMQSIAVPAGISSIGANAFLGCTNLNAINVNAANISYSSVSGILFNKNKTVVVCYPANKAGAIYNMPSTVSGISSNAFYGCRNLKCITMTMTQYNKLRSAVPSTINVISYDFGASKKYLKGSTAAAIKTMGNNIVWYQKDSSGIVSAVPAANVKAAAGYSTVLPPTSKIGTTQYFFKYTASGETYTSTSVSVEVYESWKNDEYTAGNITYKRLSDSTVSIKSCNAATSTSLVLPKQITVDGKVYSIVKIEDDALKNCTSVQSVEIPNGITAIGKSLFSTCTSLKSVTIPASVSNIEGGAFDNCKSLSSIAIDTNNQAYSSENNGLFNKNKSELIYYIPGNNNAGYSVPSSVTSIRNTAFVNGEKLTSINIEGNVSNINLAIFDHLTNLAAININENNQSYSSYEGILFNKNKSQLILCPQKKSADILKIPEEVISIRSAAFKNCNSIKSVYMNMNQYDKLKDSIPSSIKIVTDNLTENKSYLRNSTADELKAAGENIKWYEKNSDGTVTEVSESKSENGFSIYVPSTAETGTKSYYFTATVNGTTYTSKAISVEVYESWKDNDYTVDGITYTRTSESTVIIKSCAGNSNESMVLPDSIDIDGISYHIEKINNDALSSNNNLKNLDIQSSIEILSSELIGSCTSLENLTLPASLTNIEDDVFEKLTSLENININADNKLYASEDGVLFNKEKNKLIRYARNRKAKTYKIPAFVDSIGADAFGDNVNLKNMIVPDNVEAIDASAFTGCSDKMLFYVTSDKERELLISIGIENSRIKQYNWNEEGKCTIDGVIFTKNDDGTASITGYDESMGSDVVLPGEVIVEGNEYKVKEIKDNAFNNCSQLTNLIVDDGIERIGQWAFVQCGDLTGLTIADSVNYIGDGAFALCTKLTDLKLSANVKILNSMTFNSCTSLEKVVIPNGVEQLNTYAFIGCTSLKYVRVPESVKTVQTSAFANYGENTMFYVKNDACAEILKQSGIPAYRINTEDWDSNNTCTVDNIKYKKIDDSTAEIIGFDKNIESNIVISGQVNVGSKNYTITSIGDNAFNKCSNAESITIPDTVKKIGIWTFSECTNLKQVNIPNSVTEIGNGSFALCENLENIKLPDSIGVIHTHTFSGCNSLKHVTIPNSVKTIETYAFMNCAGIKDITISGGIEEIQSGAFYNLDSNIVFYVPDERVKNLLTASGINSDNIETAGWNKDNQCLLDNIKYVRNDDNTVAVIGYGEGITSNVELKNEITVGGVNYKVKSIKNGAFNKCDNMESIVIPDGIDVVEDWVFTESKNLTTVKFEGSTNTIKDGTFALCTSLKNIELPDGLKEVSGLLFNGCSALENITIPASVEKINSFAFINCSNLKSVTIMGSNTVIGDGAFTAAGNNASFSVYSNNVKESLMNIGILEDKISVIGEDDAQDNAADMENINAEDNTAAEEKISPDGNTGSDDNISTEDKVNVDDNTSVEGNVSSEDNTIVE